MRIETSTIEGFPDVEHAFGTLELKYKPRWPVRPTTPLRIRHATAEQRKFWVDRTAAGGTIKVLLKVASDWLLFDGQTAAEILGHTTKAELEEAALKVWKGRLDRIELVQLLRHQPGR